MKKKIFYVLMIACIGRMSIVNTSCSNQTDLVANEQQEKAGSEGGLFRLACRLKTMELTLKWVHVAFLMLSQDM